MLPLNPAQLPALLQRAQRHQVAGQLPQARQVMETILAAKPDLAVVHFNLAKVLLNLEEPDKALDHLDRAADLKPDEAVVWRLFATTVKSMAQPDRSAAFLAKAKKARLDRKLLLSLQDILNPKAAKSRASIGSAVPADVQQAIALLREGRFQDAAARAARLDKAHPNVALIVDILANAQSELGHSDTAENSFKRAIRIDPNYPEARANYGQFLVRQGRYEEATTELRGALRLMPDMPGALVNLGTALHRQFRISQAVKVLKRALELMPDSVPVRLEMADCLLTDRQPAEALKVVGPILDVAMPNAINLVLHARALADLQRMDEAEGAIDKALSTATNKTTAMISKAEMLQTMGQFDAAEALLRKAITLEPGLGMIYNTLAKTKKLAADDQLIAQMQRLHADPETTRESRMYLGFALAKAMEDSRAFDKVFTYLRPANDQMRTIYPYDIERHNDSNQRLLALLEGADFAPRGNSDFAPIFVTGLPRSGTTLIEQIIASHSRVGGGGELGYAYVALAEAAAVMRTRGMAAFSLPDADITKLAQQIESRMRAAVPGADIITDKGVASYEMIGPIRMLFPKARIIVVRRDPRDTLVSMYKNQFPEGRHLYTNSLSDLGAYYQGFVKILDFWRAKLPGSFHEIGYEALIAEPESQARALIAACGLDWEDKCLAFHENTRPVQTLSVHQVRQPLYASSMKTWQRYQDDLDALFDALGPEYDPRVAGEKG